MISISRPSFNKTLRHFDKLMSLDVLSLLKEIGELGVKSLSANTPVDTGETASGWSYKVTGSADRYKIVWYNSVMAGRVPLVILLQYGHMTKNGWFVSGRNFINPAMDGVYNELRKRLQSEIRP